MNYSDLTILIPIRIDSSDRLRNLHVLTDNLKKLDCVHIIILEADSQSRMEPIEGVQQIFVEDHNPLFYRTHYINVLCSMARSKYIGIWDSDVIVCQEQMEQAMTMLRTDKADMVYPFDGRCYHVDGEILHKYISIKDDKILTSDINNLYCIYGIHTSGGAFLVNRNAYIEAGGDNEKFKGWGPEDLERFKRWEVRGYRVLRTEGAIFHLHHYRGENSRYFNQNIKHSALQALFKTCRETNEYSDFHIPVYIFNLSDKTERKELILSQFEGRREFEPILVKACQHRIRAVGLWQNIVKAVQKAKKRKDEMIILCRDNHVFTENYSSSDFIRNVVKANEQGCDIMMGGVSDFGTAIPIAYSRYWVDWFLSTQFIIVYAHSFDIILNYNFKDTDSVNEVFSEIFTRKLIFYPFISRQRNFEYPDITMNNNRENEIDHLSDTASARLAIIDKVHKTYNYRTVCHG